MLTQDRRHQLLEMVRLHGFASFAELAETLAVSESTVRRDAEYLERRSAVHRVHGGILYSGSQPKLPHFEDRHAPATDAQKRAIAAAVANLVENGDTLMMDGGSTVYEVARLLVGRPLHVLTVSLPLANLFATERLSDLLLIGGNICPRTGVAQGPYAKEMIGQFRVRKTVLGIAGATEEGFFNNDILRIETQRAMMRAAEEAIVVADSTKFGHRSLALLCGLGDVATVVVDDGLSPAWRQHLAAAGVRLVIADTGQTNLNGKPRDEEDANP